MKSDIRTIAVCGFESGGVKVSFEPAKLIARVYVSDLSIHIYFAITVMLMLNNEYFEIFQGKDVDKNPLFLSHAAIYTEG